MSAARRRRGTPLRAGKSLSLQSRVMLLAVFMVALVFFLVAFVLLRVISSALYSDLDNQLKSRVEMLVASGSLAADPAKAIDGTAYSDVNAMLVNPPRSIYSANQPGQRLPVGAQEKAVIRGELFWSRRTVAGQRVLAVRLPDGATLLISKSLAPTEAVMLKVTRSLLIVCGIGVVVAAAAGSIVIRVGLRPVGRLTEAAERVARTDNLRPIPVNGSDELARLTEAFNAMLRALAESRERQARLVADAGHELKTPLTSLRTNVELLMASAEPGAAQLPEEEMAELRADAIGQIEELSTLVGDLVDLTREDRQEAAFEQVDMSEIVDRTMERVRRRRNDVEFDVDVIPWQVYGDAAGLSRAVLNLLDNAAKWSPSGERVALRMRQIDPSHVELVVSDHGPGIPPQERDLVFERFFRSDSARAMPGFGLGLAIVKQVVLKHDGQISIEETVPGGRPPGTLFRMVLPGSPVSTGGVPLPAHAVPVGREPGPTATPETRGRATAVSDGSQSTQAG
ncbi:MAG TPA: HAMP domain-containing sensor histidine kinase [Mycobacterium sp.]|nr:HAMP domain-containing sensor histidine kinase [Mycobacterium sp.]